MPAYTLSPVIGISGAAAVVVDPSTHRVYTATPQGHSVVVVDGLTHSTLATIAVTDQPTGLAIDVATHRLFVVGATSTRNPEIYSAHMFIVDTTTNAIITTVPITTSVSAGVAVDPISQRVYMPPLIYDEAGRTLGTLPPTGAVNVFGIDPALHRLYLVDQTTATVTVYDTTTRKIGTSTKVGSWPLAIAVDRVSHSVYVANEVAGSVSVISGSTSSVVATITGISQPDALAIDSASQTLYIGASLNIANFGAPFPATLTVISTATNTVEATVGVPVQSGSALDLDSTTHTVWLAAGQLAAVDPVVSRRSGADRFATAAAISAAAYDNQGADAVVLARSDTFPDALLGAPFAASKNAPLLYTSGSTLPAATKAEIARVLAPGKTIYLLGGTSAIPASVATQLTGLGYVVTRLSGSNRYATAVAVADAMGDPSVQFLATSTNYADALAAGPAATKSQGAILLTNGSALPPETAAYLDAHPGTSYAIGGPAASADPSASGIAGSDRYATAALVAQQFFTAPTTVGLASGTTFADALPAAAYLSRVGGPLLLTDPAALPSSASAYLTTTQSSVSSALVFGGPSAVSAAAQSQLSAALGR